MSHRVNPVIAACIFALCTATASAQAEGGEVDLGLEEVLNQAHADDIVSTIVFLWDQADVGELKAELNQERARLDDRRRETVRLLVDTATFTQQNLLNHLKVLHERGRIQTYQPFWIMNAVRVDASPRVIRELAAHPDVKRIYFNIGIEGISPASNIQPDQPQQAGGTSLSTPEIGLQAIRVPEAWSLGYTGQGRLVATLDTGVDGNHPALASRWRGHHPDYANNPGWAWFDPVTNTNFPQEFHGSSHGTHTMGTAVGGAPGDPIGVAPGADWMHAAVIDRININQTVADAIASFEWIVNPTGNPNSSFGVPDVCSNSWGVTAGMGYPACDELFWSFIDNAEAAGIVMIFAAGNEGNGGLRRPADRATSDFRNMAVAAVNANNAQWPVASFSSRGPTFCTLDGTAAEKPDISAPGVAVRSAVNGGGYGQLDGTSMAAPHIAGVAALIREACPELTPEEVMQIIYDTAVDLGTPGKNSTYGYGMVDAYEAVLLAEANCSFGLLVVGNVPSFVPPGQPIPITVRIVENNENLVPGSALLLYRHNENDAFQSAPLDHIGGELYEAMVPAGDCDDTLQYYIIAEGDGGTIRTVPSIAPDEVLKTHIGEMVTTELHVADFQDGFPSGWTPTGLWNVTSGCSVSGACLQNAEYAYFGNTSNCGTGVSSGTLTSSPIELPEIGPLGSLLVRFCYNMQRPIILASSSFSIGGIQDSLPIANTWTTRSVNVTSLAGQSVQMQWSYSNSWPFSNPRGLQVDAVSLEVTALQCEFVDDCPADINNDGNVDGLDLLVLLNQWGPCIGCSADLNGNETVDGLDLLLMLEAWGECP